MSWLNPMNQKLHLKLTIAAALSLVGACAPADDHDHEGPEAEACEHLVEGPSSAATAATDLSSAPDVSEGHTRHDVTLIDVEGGKGGSVAYASGEAGDYLLFLGSDVPLAIYDASGAEVAIEDSQDGVEACAEVAAVHTVELGVGTYELRFGPTAEESVQLVIEHAAHAHDAHDEHDEHEGEE